jgi:hypothetical protein
MIGIRFSTHTVQVDFEISMMNALRHELPETRIRSCFFHFAQAIWRNVQEFGLTCQFRSDTRVSKTVRRIAALPLLPLEAINRVWQIIREQAPTDVTEMTDLL